MTKWADAEISRLFSPVPEYSGSYLGSLFVQ